MANHDFKYFYEDEVFRITKKGALQFGMVIENAEFASSDESSDDEEQPVKVGQIRVAWYPQGLEEVVSERRVHLADRSLMPGDVVRRLVQGKNTQRGYCRDVKVYSSVQVIGTNQVIFGVKSEDLTPLEAFKTDILICMDGWVGMVRTVKSKLTLRFIDGSKVTVDDEVAEDLDDIRDKRDPECEFKRYDFYPGQILFGPVKSLEGGGWIECSQEIQTARKHKPHKAFKVTVEEIDFQSLGVSWMCRAYFSSNTNSDEAKAQPKYKVDGDNLTRVKMLNVFDPCTLQIGDRNFYTMKDSDIVMMKSEWKKLQKDQLMKGKKDKPVKKVAKLAEVEHLDEDDNSSEFEDCEVDSDAASVSSHDSSSQNIEGKPGKKKVKHQPGLMTKVLKKKKLKKTKKTGPLTMLVVKPGDKVVTETLSTRSEVDVVWQDGSVETAIPSAELYPIHHLDDHEFFPGDFVTEAKEGFQPHSYGVVQDVDHAGRCCRVKWFRTYTEGAQPQPIYVSTADASAYDLKDHPDFKYRPGSIVIRVMNSAGDDCGLGAGQVLDNHPSGQVSVWWAGEGDGKGVRSTCWPQDLYKVGEYDSDEGELWEDEDESGDESGNDSWETEEEQEGFEDVKPEELHTDEMDIKPKLAAKIEKARIAMTRLEEIFSENPTLQTQGVMKQLLDVYKDCRYLDKLMGTEFFHEREFSGLLDRIRDQDRISSVEAAVKDHVNRLFSQEVSPSKDSGNGSLLEESPGGSKEKGESPKKSDESKDDSAIEVGEEIPSSLVCGKLCSLIKTQLIKSHHEVVRRFGEVMEAKEEKAKEEDTDIDLDDLDVLVARGLAALNFVPYETVFPGGSLFRTPAKEDKQDDEACKDKPSDGPAVPASPDLDLTSPMLDRSLSLSNPLSPGSFVMLDGVADTHKFKLTIFQPSNIKNFVKHVRKEIKLLQSSLPPGIIVKGYEDRMDLFSAMIHGPKNTPYEDGIFFFDFQLGCDYPTLPPSCHYISYCTDRLNPNLYEEGKVCVSLLGTWSGKGTETWTPDSNLLQLLVSIQGLILVREPYFNEAGYEKQKGTQQGEENSRMYNEMAVLKLVQSMTKLVRNPPKPFEKEIMEHWKNNAIKLMTRLMMWKKISVEQLQSSVTPVTPTTPGTFAQLGTGSLDLPDFPLVPASKGFCLTLDKAIKHFEEALNSVGINARSVSGLELALD
eukprot:GFUD01037358.1.p1 GENE.GFUD01037358.1~~GFUD01037358.1.p1  ORF type:complete len:1189 (+),score=379.97 GFUD01037358.1:41-3607(+)